MHELASRPRVRGGFVHVPFAPDQVEQGSSEPSLSVASMAEAIAAVVRTSLTLPIDAIPPTGATRRSDVALAAGSIH
ncbi:hypothetical protein [Arthrobacter sp. K5]|jgi:pyroglutamyl-peptidase|uniref:Pyroglutamyl-peptidase I n=1 Tax=Arthrobacter sp. K5 TaxID=2839623 RepID=A0AAU8ERH2_9MICC